jgi:uncharacterized protein YukE
VAPSSGFRVDPDKLLAVADRVHALLQDVNGGSGLVSGNLPRYTEKARADALSTALASFWSGEDVFATAYGAEHDGVVLTFKSIADQLTKLEAACRSTAVKYQHEDTRSKQVVTQSGPDTSSW